MPVKKLKHHILPHPQHKKRATLLHNKAVFLYSVGIFTIFSFFKNIPTAIPGILGYASNISITELLRYSNDRRETAGISSLVVNPKLTQAAQKKAEHMFKNNYWAHVAPDGTDPWSFIIGENYDYLYAGENLAKNFSNSKDVVEAWYKSPSHRENLISDKYSDVGFAVVNGVLDGYETTLVVQLFGKTREAPAQVAVKGAENNTTVRLAEKAVPVAEKVPVAIAKTPTPIVDMYSTTKAFVLGFASFMLALFALDVWYSRKHAILKLTGHTFAHMLFLVFAVASVYFSLQPGRLI